MNDDEIRDGFRKQAEDVRQLITGSTEPGRDLDPARVGALAGELIMAHKELAPDETVQGQFIPAFHVRLTAAGVLDQHVQLHDRHQHPSRTMREYIQNFADDTVRKERETALMFYPFWRDRESERDPDWARLYLQHISKTLFTARTYQVTADMMKVAREVYLKTVTHIGHLEAREMPHPTGFLWMDEPFTSTDLHGKLTTTRAISWSLESVTMLDPVTKRKFAEPAVRLVYWSIWGDFNEYEQTLTPERVAEFRELIGDVSLAHTMVMPFGQRFGSWKTASGGSSDPLGNISDMGNLVHVLWMLLDSEIAATKRDPVDRSTRRRALRSIKQGEVSVVTLRRTRAVSDDLDHDPAYIDWACRWLVQGHWRHLGSYEAGHHHALHDGDGRCLTCGTRLAWIKPHIKGPEDRPLRNTKQVYRLSR